MQTLRAVLQNDAAIAVILHYNNAMRLIKIDILNFYFAEISAFFSLGKKRFFV